MEIKPCKLYNIKELEEILDTDRRTIYKLISTGKLRGIPTGYKEKKRVFGKYLLEYLGDR